MSEPEVNSKTSIPGENALVSLPGNKIKLAKIRHELRTPINHIIGYSEMLEEDILEKGQLVFLDDIKKVQNAGRQLLDLVGSVFAGNEGAKQVSLRTCLADIRTWVNHIIGYSEILQDQVSEAGFMALVPDLQKISGAAKALLAMVEPYLLDPGADEESPAPEPSLTSPSADTSFTPVTERNIWQILVVDDDPQNREMLSRRLIRLGYTATTANSGPAALELLASKPFDLVLLDLLMPGMDGGEVLRRIKGNPKLRDIPVIMLSALDTLDSIIQCIDAGAEDYVAKPFNPIFLKSRIGAVLEKKRLRDQEHVYLRRIQEEQEKSEKLLLNILPAPIAVRLKNGETPIADSFSETTVVFADVVGFTSLSQHVSAGEVVKLLDEIFSAFDVLAEKHGLEKIKTIGDAYMAASGLPSPRPDHAVSAANFALDVLSEINRLNRGYQSHVAVRVGISAGPAIAGIIGRNRFIYDLWGDTVNTASRMESHGVPGRIQVTARVFELLNDQFQFERRGIIEVKGKGEMETYFLVKQK